MRHRYRARQRAGQPHLDPPPLPSKTWGKPGGGGVWARQEAPLQAACPTPAPQDLQPLDHFLQLLAAAFAQGSLGVSVRALDPGHHLLEQEALRILKA